MKRGAVLAVLALAACAAVEPPAPTIPVPPTPAPTTPAPTTPAPVVEADELPGEPAAPTTPAPVVEADESRQAAELLGYYQRVAGLGLEEQKRELATATQSLNRERTNANRVRLALVYSIPGTAFQDDVRAAQLLEPVASGSGSGALRQLAGLVYAQINDRVKTQKRADQLKEQVEQLRAVDKQLIERGSQTPPPRKP